MFAVNQSTYYELFMIDFREYHPDREPTLDGMVSDVYGRKYVGQQTGDMLPNDTTHRYSMTPEQVEEFLYGVDPEKPYYDPPRYGDRTYFGRAGFEIWLADDKEYKYDFEHYRQAPGPETALAMLIEDGHLPYGEYLVIVTW